MNDKLIQLYSQSLAEANHKILVLMAEVERLQEELAKKQESEA